MTVPDSTREVEEDGWEEEAITNVSVGASEEAAIPQSSSRRHKVRKAKKREREKEKRRPSNRENNLREGVPSNAGTREETVEQVVEWPLVDDRSLSLDEEDIVEEETVGLGDGLLSALAAVSEPEVHDAKHRPAVAPARKNKERGKDRRKRKHKEHGKAPSQTSEMAGDASSSASSHPVEVRSALLDAYGQRRRIGDSVLSEQALVAEVIKLINVRLFLTIDLQHSDALDVNCRTIPPSYESCISSTCARFSFRIHVTHTAITNICSSCFPPCHASLPLSPIQVSGTVTPCSTLAFGLLHRIVTTTSVCFFPVNVCLVCLFVGLL